MTTISSSIAQQALPQPARKKKIFYAKFRLKFIAYAEMQTNKGAGKNFST